MGQQAVVGGAVVVKELDVGLDILHGEGLFVTVTRIDTVEPAPHAVAVGLGGAAAQCHQQYEYAQQLFHSAKIRISEDNTKQKTIICFYCRAKVSSFSIFAAPKFDYSEIIRKFAARNNIKIMTAIELRAELFREMSPLLDNESAMTKMLAFVKSLVPAKKRVKRMTANERLDAALSKFSGDFGGNKDAMEIAQELRQGADMVREVETW